MAIIKEGEDWYYKAPNYKYKRKCEEYICDSCGNTFYRAPNHIKSEKVYCNHTCANRSNSTGEKGEKNRNWKGGRRVATGGYISIYVNNYPTHDNVVLEHRYVMEQKLGRYLTPEETVYHKNGIITDNRIENLELWVSRHPKGQRVEDLVKWAKEILELYGDSKNERTG